jgi:hypothetical protein
MEIPCLDQGQAHKCLYANVVIALQQRVGF